VTGQGGMGKGMGGRPGGKRAYGGRGPQKGGGAWRGGGDDVSASVSSGVVEACVEGKAVSMDAWMSLGTASTCRTSTLSLSHP